MPRPKAPAAHSRFAFECARRASLPASLTHRVLDFSLMQLQRALGLCKAPTELDAFVHWITEALESIPQVDYPEASHTLPANPVSAVCALDWTSSSAQLDALGTAVAWYYGKNAAGCIEHATNSQVGGGTPGDGPEPNSAWGYQSCTETLHAFSTPPGPDWTRTNAVLDATNLCPRPHLARSLSVLPSLSHR